MQFKRDAANVRYITTRFSAAVYKRLLTFFDAVDKTEDKYFRFTSEGFEPLVIENLETVFVGYPVYSIAHYYDMNGDAMRDPDMQVFVDRTHGHIIPMYFRQDNAPFTPYGVLEREVFADPEARSYRPHVASDLDSFLNLWSKNILDQGFRAAQAAQDAAPMSLDDFAATFA